MQCTITAVNCFSVCHKTQKQQVGCPLAQNDNYYWTIQFTTTYASAIVNDNGDTKCDLQLKRVQIKVVFPNQNKTEHAVSSLWKPSVNKETTQYSRWLQRNPCGIPCRRMHEVAFKCRTFERGDVTTLMWNHTASDVPTWHEGQPARPPESSIPKLIFFFISCT